MTVLRTTFVGVRWDPATAIADWDGIALGGAPRA